MENDDYEGLMPPRWRCQECGEAYDWAMPPDRAKYYASPKARKCPKCKSEACVPEGF